MPINRNYNPGSIVYFQGDRGDEVFVLKSGRVILIETSPETGEEMKQDVQKGEFFGVKSSLGRYPREDTAQVIGPTVLLVFKHAEFEQLVLKNTRLIMKMLQVFSKQLRDIHRQVRQVMKTGAAREPAFELMNVSETFFRLGQHEHAVYAFNKYLEQYPNGSHAERARELMAMAQKGSSYPIGYPALEEKVNVPDSDHVQEMASAKADSGDLNTIVESGLQAFAANNFAVALENFTRVINSPEASSHENEKAVSRAHYEKARAELKLNRIKEATTTLMTYLKKYGTGEFVKEALFDLGVIAEMTGNKERARSFYHKTATIPPQDNVSNEARKRLQNLG